VLGGASKMGGQAGALVGWRGARDFVKARAAASLPSQGPWVSFSLSHAADSYIPKTIINSIVLEGDVIILGNRQS
jgi:hypothetical protein